MTVHWPAQAVARQGQRLILPMGRGRKSFSFPLCDLPEQIGAVCLVWNGGDALHLVVPAPPVASAAANSDTLVQAAADLGEIHQVAVTTSTGQGLIVTGPHHQAAVQQDARSACSLAVPLSQRLEALAALAVHQSARTVQEGTAGAGPAAQGHAAGGGLLPCRRGADALRG